MPVWTYAGPELQSQTYAATITVDASSADKFTTDLTGNPTSGPPANPIDGQIFLYRFRAGAAARTISFSTGTGGFRATTSNTTAAKLLNAGQTAYGMFAYDLTANKWDILSWDVAG